MDFDHGDLRHHRTYHREAKEGREFILRVRTKKRGIVELGAKLVIDAVSLALKWRSKADWAELLDFERKTVLSGTRVARLWRAAAGEYGRPTKEHPYIVRGPTINPTFMEEFWTLDLLKAVDYAYYWQSLCEGPYWCEVRGPNGNIVLSRMPIERMYHAEVKGYGGSIVTMVVSVGGPNSKAYVGPGVYIPIGEVNEYRKIV